MNVSQAIAKVMKAYGAEYVFTLTGAPQDPLIEMQNHEEIRVVLGRSERSALFMADAYARLTGKPTFGIVQFGPGATYLPASIIDAFWANSPLIAISGSITTRTKYRYEYQEIDQTGMFPAMTKWCGDLPAPEARSAFPAAPWTPRARLAQEIPSRVLTYSMPFSCHVIGSASTNDPSVCARSSRGIAIEHGGASGKAL